MNLRAFALERPLHSPLFIGEERMVDVEMLRQELVRRSAWLSEVLGDTIALSIRSPLELAIALVALDGRCSQLLLLPEVLSDGELSDLMTQAGCTRVVTDEEWRRCASGLDDAIGDLQASYAPIATKWLVATSGTTGRPKLVGHTLQSLCRTTKKDQAAGAKLRWGQMYSITRFAGLQVFLQSVIGGSSMVMREVGDDLGSSLERFKRFHVNAISATPTQWRTVMMTSGADGLQLNRVTLGGEIATQDTLDALKKKYPLAKVSHVYASTELGVGFSVTDGLEGFPAAWLDEPARGLAIDSATGELLCTHDGLRTGDMVERKGERVLFAGRINGAINVGGSKVMPETVERALLTDPDVVAALVRGKKSAVTGNLVVADVLLRTPVTNRAERSSALLEHCRNSLQRHEIPALINFVSEMKTGGSGKVLRNG